MIAIGRIAHATFETPDRARLTSYYTDLLGLSVVSSDKDATYLTAPLDRHSIVLRNGPAARCAGLGFYVGPSVDLADYARQLKGDGVTAGRLSDAHPGMPDMLRFTDPKGTLIEVSPQPALGAPLYAAKGVAPMRLGHVAFNVTDVASCVDFYCKVLGFRFSDSIEDFFVWLRCSPEHHTVNFVKGARAKMHHIAFEVRDMPQLMIACDFLSKNGYQTIWGPGRHGCGHNIFTYHRDPDGNIIELYAELDQMREELGWFEPRPWHRDRPQKPKVWPADPAASNLWGPMPPPDFLD